MAIGSTGAGTAIDLTGNWICESLPRVSFHISEPYVADGDHHAFTQTLTLPPGAAALVLVYREEQDRRSGYSLDDQLNAFPGLSLDGATQLAQFVAEPGEAPRHYRARIDLGTRPSPLAVALRLTLRNTKPLQTLLECAQAAPRHTHYRAIPPVGPGSLALIKGIPFLLREVQFSFCGVQHGIDHGSLRLWQNGLELDCGDVAATRLHVLGLIHNIDIANGSWYSPKGDHGYAHFVGDEVGRLHLQFDDGEESCPLVYGHNIWYARAWDMFWHWDFFGQFCGHVGDGLYRDHPEMRELIRDSLVLSDGMRAMGAMTNNARYMLSIELSQRRLRSIRITGHDRLHDYPLISAVTIETDTADSSATVALPDLGQTPFDLRSVGWAKLRDYRVEVALDALKHQLYTFVDEQPRLTAPEIPTGYFGPEFDFRGHDFAIRAATYLYRNGPECGAFIADRGTGCSSSTARRAILHYMWGLGAWFEPNPDQVESHFAFPVWPSLPAWFELYRTRAPGQLPNRIGNAWTRGIGELLREAVSFGYGKFTDTYLDWLDTCLFQEADPPHWNRIAGLPDFATYRVQVGDIEERGNRENDGHGICMWGRYQVWHKAGRPAGWNRRRFAATAAAVEWIQWQLDTDHLRPGVRQDVLYTESECAHGSYDIYSSYNCLHGLKLSIRMAHALGEDTTAARWQQLYERLRQGILTHLVDEGACGPRWHTDPATDWQDHAHRLVHLQLAPDGDTYTPLEDYAAGDETDRTYLAISRNSYRELMLERNYNCLRMFGYGQGMMLQSALLLDEMEDARKFAELLLTYCYLPHLERWLAPEGIITHPSGKYYLPVNGYMGQDSHLTDSVKALRLMLGLDDNRPDHLRLVPRFPADWPDLSVTGMPVADASGDQRLSFQLQRRPGRCSYAFQLTHPVREISVRLGPFPPDLPPVRLTVNDQSRDARPFVSGDSAWVWVHGCTGSDTKVELRYES